MINIASDVKNHLSSLQLFAPIGLEAFGPASKGIIIRSDPSSATATEYIDGSSTGKQILSIYARSNNTPEILDALDKIREALDKPKIDLTSVLFISVKVLTLASLIGKEETGESIYQMTVEVDFDYQNKQGVFYG